MFADKVMQNCSTTGTSTYALGDTVGAFRPWRSQFADGSVVFYWAQNQAGTKWEFGWSKLSYGAPDTMSRNFLASSSGALVAWTGADAPFNVYSAPIAAFMRRPWVDVGAAPFVAATPDIFKVVKLDVTAASRSVTLPPGSSVGESWRLEALGYGSDANSVLVTPAAGDKVDRFGAGVPLIVPGFVKVSIEWDGQQWRTSYAPPARTGDFKLTLDDSAEAGWVTVNDGTIGNATSGGSARANDDAVNLFTFLRNKFADGICPVSGGRGASAAADWAAGKTIGLTKMLGRALIIAGAGAGLTARNLGTNLGEENHVLSAGEMPSHGHGVNDPWHSHGAQNQEYQFGGNFGSGGWAINTNPGQVSASPTGISIQGAGGGGAHNNMQPSTVVAAKLKL